MSECDKKPTRFIPINKFKVIILVLYLIMVICQIDDYFSAGLQSGFKIEVFHTMSVLCV